MLLFCWDWDWGWMGGWLTPNGPWLKDWGWGWGWGWFCIENKSIGLFETLFLLK